MDDSDKPQTIGIWITTSLVIGTIIGSGIFLLPVSLSPYGANVPIGWGISGVGILCIAYGMARLSRLGGDGIQANVEREFGPTVAFLVAWSFWVSNWTAMSSIAVGAASALAFVGIDFGGATGVLLFAIFWIVSLTGLNAMGVRAAGGFSMITVAIKILPLLAVIWLFAERGVRGGPFQSLAATPVTFINIAGATALTFWSFTGFESATTPVGKVRDAARTVPRALIRGTAFVVLLYVIAGNAIQLLLPASVIAESPAPFADALVSQWGPGVALFAALAIAISAIGCLNGVILATGELGYAMALRGDLPPVMTRTRGGNTPYVSQIVCSALSILLLLANSSKATASLFTFIVLLSAAAMVVVYIVAVLAAWKCSTSLRARSILALAMLFILFVIYGIGLEASLWFLLLLAAGLGVRWLMRRLGARDLTALPATGTPSS